MSLKYKPTYFFTKARSSHFFHVYATEKMKVRIKMTLKEKAIPSPTCLS